VTPGEAVRASADYLVLPSKLTGGNDVRAAWHPLILAERSNIAPVHRQMIAPPSFDQNVTTARIVAFADSVSFVLMTFAPHLACYRPLVFTNAKRPDNEAHACCVAVVARDRPHGGRAARLLGSPVQNIVRSNLQ